MIPVDQGPFDIDAVLFILIYEFGLFMVNVHNSVSFQSLFAND